MQILSKKFLYLSKIEHIAAIHGQKIELSILSTYACRQIAN